jgi:sortase A
MRPSTPAAVLLAVGLLGGCSTAGPAATPRAFSGSATTSAAPTTTTSTPTPSPTTSTSAPTPTPTGPTLSDGRAVEARLSIPALRVTGLVVLPYQGWTDDGPGTAIQNRGLAASPHGPRGGTGPGGIGNYQVTAHRTTKPAPFRDLPSLAEGQEVHVDSGGVRYTYRVTETRKTSFRSAQSLEEQRAAVPGKPGATPTQAMITLSTCLTPEDRAAGNFWSDEYTNPEHRADKIGVLVESQPL